MGWTKKKDLKDEHNYTGKQKDPMQRDKEGKMNERRAGEEEGKWKMILMKHFSKKENYRVEGLGDRWQKNNKSHLNQSAVYMWSYMMNIQTDKDYTETDP